MTLWRVRGAVSEVTCSLEHTAAGWRLSIHRRPFGEYVELFADAERARARANEMRQELVAMGFQLA